MKSKNKYINLCLSVLICVLFMIGLSVHAQSVDDIRVLKISPQDERAIIKTPEGEMRIIKVGDVLWVMSSGLRVASSELEKKDIVSELRVMEITEGRVVFEEETDTGMETVIIRVEDGKQRVERIKKTIEPQTLISVPQSTKDTE